MKKSFFILTTLILAIVILFVARAFVSNKISTSGVALGVTQEEVEKYKTENTMLREKIYGLSSLNYVASAAAKIGFVESGGAFALTRGAPIARKE